MNALILPVNPQDLVNGGAEKQVQRVEAIPIPREVAFTPAARLRQVDVMFLLSIGLAWMIPDGPTFTLGGVLGFAFGLIYFIKRIRRIYRDYQVRKIFRFGRCVLAEITNRTDFGTGGPSETLRQYTFMTEDGRQATGAFVIKFPKAAVAPAGSRIAVLYLAAHPERSVPYLSTCLTFDIPSST